MGFGFTQNRLPTRGALQKSVAVAVIPLVLVMYALNRRFFRFASTLYLRR
jgi:hypothetical protein